MVGIGNRFNFENIRCNAYKNNLVLDTSFHPEGSDIETVITHLNDCKNKPTVALLARKNTRTHNYPDYFKRNLQELYSSSSSIRKADLAYREEFKSLYPKTGKARRLLIKDESIVLSYVKPIQKNIKRTILKFLSKI